jgi:RIO kinase 1
MALRLSKKKRPAKEEKMFNFNWPKEDGVFDRYCLLDLQEFFNKGLIKSVDFPIAKGKEANVYRATTPKGDYLAIKIYRLTSPSFIRFEEYIKGDSRFPKFYKSKTKLIFTWAKKEFSNLRYLKEIGIAVPTPIDYKNNIVLMEFLGEGGLPYPQLAKIGPANPKEEMDFLIEQIEKMYKNNIVHADMSEYNILVGPENLYIIDCAQAVLATHPKAKEFYLRDKQNIVNYFKKFLIK